VPRLLDALIDFANLILPALYLVVVHVPSFCCLAQVCSCRKDDLKFSRLSSDEVEAQLTALAERDDDIAGRD